jgi:hypothetical protein
MAWSAKAWILNVIELFHWVSFPIGFYLFWTIFENSGKLSAAIGGENPIMGLFFLLLAHVPQVYGGGISGNLMHQYEGWQVAPFRNPLKPHNGEAEPDYNNAWLRAVAYQMLFSFQTLGVICITLGNYGINKFTTALTVVTFLIMALGPELPHCTSVFPRIPIIGKVFTKITQGRPVFPLSIYLFFAFLLNSFVATAAYIKMFGKIDWTSAAVVATLPSWLSPILAVIPSQILAVIPFVLVAFGGIFEGLVAESTFNQLHHLLAFVFLDLGLALHVPYYKLLMK